ncbi:two-partner secretion domain-containing protein [Phormidesmis priestleyi]
MKTQVWMLILGQIAAITLSSNCVAQIVPDQTSPVGERSQVSTANRLKFADGFEFDARATQTPPLLTISAPIGLQYGSNPGEVRSQGASLQVPNGQTLTLAGGTVNIDGGRVFAPGGRVELAGVAASGEVGLTQQGQAWRLSVPEGLARADVSMTNDAIVNVRSGGGGSIAITARNLTGTGTGTRMRAGIAAGLGTIGAQAGDIDINTTEAVNLDAMLISNAIVQGGTGNAGDINITTSTLSFINGAQVSDTTFGQGDAGNNIMARDGVFVDGVESDGRSSGPISIVNAGAIGQGGNINITTGTLLLTNGGGVNATTFGQGDAGNIRITARDSVSIDGRGSNCVFPSAISTVVQSTGIGQGGDINIITGSLPHQGGVVSAGTQGQGDAGTVTINDGIRRI